MKEIRSHGKEGQRTLKASEPIVQAAVRGAAGVVAHDLRVLGGGGSQGPEEDRIVVSCPDPAGGMVFELISRQQF